MKEALSDRAVDFLVLLYVGSIAVVGWTIGLVLSIKRRFRKEK